MREPHDPRGLGKERAELIDVGPRTTPGIERENEVIVDPADDAQLGEVVINHGFPRAIHPLAATDEVATRARAFQTRGIDGRPLHPFLATQMEPHGGRQKFSNGRRPQQPLRRFLERGEVWDHAQFQQVAERGMVFELGRQAAVVDLQKVLEHQAREELVLRELLGTEAVRVIGQRPPRRRQRRPRHRLRRFTRSCHTPFYAADLHGCLASKVRFLQSHPAILSPIAVLKTVAFEVWHHPFIKMCRKARRCRSVLSPPTTTIRGTT